MTAIQTFTNTQFGHIRTIEQDGKVLFCGKDVAAALGYENPGKAVRMHCKGGPFWTPLQTAGGTQEIRFISEGDLYRLIASSKLPAAQKFESWVFDEVLPTIRRHGMYATETAVEKFLANPDALLHTLEALKSEQDKRRRLEAEAERNRPKVLFAEALTVSDGTILVGQLAKLLSQNGVAVGQNRLFARLRDEGFLHKTGQQKNLPTQKARELGLIDIKTRTVGNPDGTVRTTYTPVVTGKGQQYFVNRFLARAAA
ncbi:phage antirepressor KilAC domain-containing protein [Dermabacteraceae bacterium P7006]